MQYIILMQADDLLCLHLHAVGSRFFFHTFKVYISLLFHCNNSCRNAPHCYIVHTLPVLMYIRKGSVQVY